MFPEVSVAVTVRFPALLPAVKTPVELLIDPKPASLTDHAYDPEPPDAVKVCVPPVAIVKVDGVTVIVDAVIVTVAEPVLPD